MPDREIQNKSAFFCCVASKFTWKPLPSLCKVLQNKSLNMTQLRHSCDNGFSFTWRWLCVCVLHGCSPLLFDLRVLKQRQCSPPFGRVPSAVTGKVIDYTPHCADRAKGALTKRPRQEETNKTLYILNLLTSQEYILPSFQTERISNAQFFGIWIDYGAHVFPFFGINYLQRSWLLELWNREKLQRSINQFYTSICFPIPCYCDKSELRWDSSETRCLTNVAEIWQTTVMWT